ncbi:MAG: hypothetical protein RBR67_07590 [Desulfobacterium sp.]|jgi:hypothetical protein|nr:hypothetical protein [Desulfobacterium sp.]
MLKNDLIQRSPAVIIMGRENLHQGRFGAVLSRAGVGKTQFLVQIAISRLLEGQNTLHISLTDPMDKINVRYKEAFTSLVESIGYVDPLKANRLWEDIEPCKTGISYNELTFTAKKLRDYLKTLRKGDIKIPSMVIVDDLDFDTDLTDFMDDLKKISEDFETSFWFSMRSHREEPLSAEGYPKQLERLKDRFDKALFLQPRNEQIEAVVLKDGDRVKQRYALDPSTLMPLPE